MLMNALAKPVEFDVWTAVILQLKAVKTSLLQVANERICKSLAGIDKSVDVATTGRRLLPMVIGISTDVFNSAINVHVM